jgi:NTP pyrophosphatase (non-canonical NTP hydrolase)
MNFRESVLFNSPTFKTDSLEKKLSLGGLGAAGEGGEVADVVKKILHHGASYESMKPKLIKEMGDVLWYIEYLCATLEISMDDVKQANIDKLKERYPNGFNLDEASKRAERI